MKKQSWFIKITLILLGLTLLASCSAGSSTGPTSCSTASGADSAVNMNNGSTDVEAVAYEVDDYAFDWKNTAHVTIKLNGGSASIEGTGAAAAGSAVTITASGTYVISGTLTDGSIVVDIDKSIDKGTVFLVLNGADITGQTSAPIRVIDAKKVVLLLEEGTENTIHGGSGCVVDAEGEPSAAIFSKADLTIAGSGTLAVTGDFNDGITCKDDLKITGGTIIIKALSDGIVGKDSLNIENADITINAGKDGMRATNDTDAGMGNVTVTGGEFTITAGGDAISAVTTLAVGGGTFNLTSGGGYPGQSTNTGNDNGMGGMKPGQQGKPNRSATTASTTASTEVSKKGLKAGQDLILNGGTFTISSYDDAVHSNMDITIRNTVLTIQSGDDGIHADSTIVINSGTIKIMNSYEAIEGADVTVNSGTISTVSDDDGFNINNDAGTFTINGGDIDVNAGGDGLDSNGTILMTGGSVYVDGPVNDGNGSIDYNSDFTISGGTLVASGSSGMAQAPSDRSAQCSILMYYSTIQSAGTALTLKDESGATVVTFTPAKKYSSVAISSPLLVKGATYTLYANDTKVTSFTISNILTYLGESGATTQGGFQGPTGRK